MMTKQLLGICLLVSLAAQCSANDKRAAGLDDLVILSPGTHERGLAEVQLKSSPDGSLKVDLTPSIHIHRNYYNGSREFQGPFVVGGPTVIVANHPSTNKRLYIEANLPSGYPTISYTGNTITYAYQDRRVVIFYSLLGLKHATVFNLAGRGIIRETGEALAEAKVATKQAVNKSPLVGTLRTSTKTSKELFVGMYDLTEQAVDMTLQTVGKIVFMVPGVAQLQSYGQQHAERSYQTEMKNEAEAARRRATEFVKTVR